jgi:hypothetical protein
MTLANKNISEEIQAELDYVMIVLDMTFSKDPARVSYMHRKDELHLKVF